MLTSQQRREVQRELADALSTSETPRGLIRAVFPGLEEQRAILDREWTSNMQQLASATLTACLHSRWTKTPSMLETLLDYLIDMRGAGALQEIREQVRTRTDPGGSDGDASWPSEERPLSASRPGTSVTGQGIQIGDNNRQTNFYGPYQHVTAGRDSYVSGGDMIFSGRPGEDRAARPADSASARSLSGPQVGRLCDALVAAFGEQAFEVFLMQRLDKDFARLTPSNGDFPYRVFKLIIRADQEGWVTGLIREAARDRPGNAVLREFAGD